MYHEPKWNHADQAIEWIHSLLTLGMKPGLKRMEWMLARLNHPERRLKFVHVGGTNGKGSTVSFLRHVLQEAGYQVGSFTSPYIERFQNRIQINGVDIPDQDLLVLTKRIKPLAEELAQSELGAPTEFEVVTMLAILYFATVAYPDLVLWEVGLGGRFDSTNVIAPILTIITSIGHDHQHILGESLPEIAFEKAGIIKSGVHTVTAVSQEEALIVIKEQAKEKQANLYVANQDYHWQMESSNVREQTFTFRSIFATYTDLNIRLRGKHQLQNASVAVMALELLKQFYALIWDEEDLRSGLAKTTWPARLETIVEKPLTIIDGAHNPEGMAVLVDYISEHYARRKIIVFYSALQDKENEEMLKQLLGKVDKLILTQFDFPRVAQAEQLLAQVEGILDKNVQHEDVGTVQGGSISRATKDRKTEVTVAEDWFAAYQCLVQEKSGTEDQETMENQENQLIIFTGSLYFVSEVRHKMH